MTVGQNQHRRATFTALFGSIAASCTLLAAPPAPPEVAQGPATLAPQQLKKLSIEDLMQLQVATVTTASKKEEKADSAPGTVARNGERYFA